MTALTGFILGLVIGTWIGMIFMCLLFVARRADDMEALRRIGP